MKRYTSFLLLLVLSVLLIPIGTAASGPTDADAHENGNQVSDFQQGPVSAFDGSFVYDYPLAVPPGRGSMTPDLTLTLRSTDGSDHDIFGNGASINIPYIHRINKTGSENIYTENHFYSSLSGELVQIGSSTRYRAKIETGDFIRYERIGDLWKATTTAGVVHTFGSASSSRQDNAASTTQIYAWMVDDTRDTNDNYIAYSYFKDNNQIYPNKITYTGHEMTDGDFAVEFDREAKTQNHASYYPAFKVTTRYRINEIRVEIDNGWVRKYTLTYGTGNNDKRDLLSEITETGQEEGTTVTKVLPSTKFEHQSTTKSFSSGGPGVPCFFVFDDIDSPCRLSDVNGDGLPDVVDSSGGGIVGKIYLNDGDQFVESSSWSLPSEERLNFQFGGARLIDVNGDLLPDIVWSRAYNDSAYSRVYINTGTGWELGSTWGLPGTFIGYANPGYVDNGYIFADVNGDGLPDILHDQGVGDGDDNSVYINTGSTWTLDTSWDLPDYDDFAFIRLIARAVDVNGDNLDDIVWSSRRGDLTENKITFINTGSGWEMDATWGPPGPFVRWDSPQEIDDYGYRFTDINGDGLVDIVYDQYIGLNDPRKVYINNGAGWTDDTAWSLPGDAGLRYSDNRAQFVDADGDGLPELLWSDKKEGSYTYGESFTNEGLVSDLLATTTLPEGGTVTVNYKTTSNYGDNDGNRDNPNLPLNLQVVNQITYDSGFGNEWGETYSYGNGEYYYEPDYLRDRKFAGFATTTKATDHSVTTTYFHQGLDGQDPTEGGTVHVFFANTEGDIFHDTSTSWDSAHDAIKGSRVRVGNLNRFEVGTGKIIGSGKQELSRTVLYFDTSAIDSTDFIHSATLSLYYSGDFYQNHDNDGEDYYAVVQVQGDSIVSDSSVNVADYDLVGDAIDNPTEGSNRIDISDIGTYTYYDFELNTTGLGWIARNGEARPTGATAGMTYLGIREGHDIQDDPFSGLNGQRNRVHFDASFVSGTSRDPKLVVETSSSSSILPVRTDDSFWRIGFPYRTEITDTNSNLYTVVRSSWETASLGDNVGFVRESGRTTLDYDGDGDHKDTAIVMTYDDTHGNLIKAIEYGEVAASTTDTSFSDIGSDKKTTTYAYASSTNRDVVNLPSRELVVDNASSTIRDTKYYYDSLAHGSVDKGNLTKQEFWATSTSYIDQEWTYNDKGLVISERDPRDKETLYTYDDKNLYVASTTDAESHTTKYTYDYSSGKVATTTDPNDNLFVTVYDALDRPVEEKVPDASTGNALTKTTYTYTDTKGATAIQKTDLQNTATSTDTYSYFDGYGRTIQERAEAESFNTYTVRDFVYGSSGLLLKESLPYFDTGSTNAGATNDSDLYTSYAYDALGRITSASTTVGETQTTYDQWKETITDSENNSKDFTYDAYNRLVQVDEKNDASTYTTTYEWDHNDNLTKITDALSNVRNITYDGLSRRLTLEDLHDTSDSTYGSWSFSYDDSGNLTSQTDPENQTIAFTYDNINRILTEDYTGNAGTEVTYAYDTCSEGKGQLCEVGNSAATTTYSYNKTGLVERETRTVNNINYETEYEYDYLGNQTLVTYPDNSKVRYSYNDAGMLERVEGRESGGAFTDLISDLDYGPHGLVTYQKHGNNIVTTREYDEKALYRLKTITTYLDDSGGSAFTGLLPFTQFFAASPIQLLALAHAEEIQSVPLSVNPIPTEETTLSPSVYAKQESVEGTSTTSETTSEINSVEESTTSSISTSNISNSAASTDSDIATTTNSGTATSTDNGIKDNAATSTDTGVATSTSDVVAATSTDSGTSGGGGNDTRTTTKENNASETIETVTTTTDVLATSTLVTNATSTANTTELLTSETMLKERYLSLPKNSLIKQLVDKNISERKDIKAAAIANIDSIARTNREKYVIEVVAIEPIEGGVQAFVRAWQKNGTQIGFGEDGSVDIERFQIFNAPILVPDTRGSIVKQWGEMNEETGKVTHHTRALHEDPKEALLQVVEHTLEIMGNIHGPDNIEKDKVGNTISTFFSAAGDGHLRKFGGGSISGHLEEPTAVRRDVIP